MNEYATVDKFDARTMRAAFDLFAQSEHLLEVELQFGARDEKLLTGKPLVRWEPTQDQYVLVGRSGYAVQPRGAAGLNQLSTVYSRHVRKAGVSLVIFGQDDEQAEDTIARVVLALEDTFGPEANCHLMGGTWKLARAHSTSCERYDLRVAIALPIVRILPAAPVAATPITPIAEVQ